MRVAIVFCWCWFPVVFGCTANTDDPGGDGSAGSSNNGNGGGRVSSGGSQSGNGGAFGTTVGGAWVASGGSAGTSVSSGGSSGTSAGNAGSSNGGTVNAAKDCPTTQEPGTWQNVTPDVPDLLSTFSGAQAVLVDPARPSDVYVNFDSRGIWRSTDCGMTFTKVNTGTNGDALDSGRAWYAAIDGNPERDPETAPDLYFTQGYGAAGVWKSTDFGVNWSSVWDGNIYAPDGVTNISSDVGSDIASLFTVDPADSQHATVTLHSYEGSGDNNGIFETTDGGGKWIVRKTETFDFQVHADVFCPLAAATWIVSAGQASDGVYMFRTTDGGEIWNNAEGELNKGIGRFIAKAGSAIYSGTYYGPVYKSTDLGATWAKLDSLGGRSSWVVATGKNIYAGNGCCGEQPAIFHAPLDNDAEGVSDSPAGMADNGEQASVTFDGEHYIIIAGQWTSGVWRYVEP